VDGKSPAEYITENWQKEKVRSVARKLLLEPVSELHLIKRRWLEAMEDRLPKPTELR
jgi:hypothetical protein